MLFNYPPTVCHTRLIYALLNLFIFCDFSPVACNNNLTAEKDAMLTTEDGGGVVMGDCSFFISQHTNTHRHHLHWHLWIVLSFACRTKAFGGYRRSHEEEEEEQQQHVNLLLLVVLHNIWWCAQRLLQYVCRYKESLTMKKLSPWDRQSDRGREWLRQEEKVDMMMMRPLWQCFIHPTRLGSTPPWIYTKSFRIPRMHITLHVRVM